MISLLKPIVVALYNLHQDTLNELRISQCLGSTTLKLSKMLDHTNSYLQKAAFGSYIVVNTVIFTVNECH